MNTRKIKFRAWDKKNKKMVDVIDFTCMNYSNLYEVMQYTGLKDKNGKEIYEGDIIQSVQRLGRVPSSTKIQRVIFYDNDNLQFCVNSDFLKKDKEWQKEDKGRKDGTGCLTVYCFNPYEAPINSLMSFYKWTIKADKEAAECDKNNFLIKIIGNIFENKDLLTNK